MDSIPCSTTTGPAWLIPCSKDATERVVTYLRKTFNEEVDQGLTYPHNTHFNVDEFRDYWFNFCIVLCDQSDLTGTILGSYYVSLLTSDY